MPDLNALLAETTTPMPNAEPTAAMQPANDIPETKVSVATRRAKESKASDSATKDEAATANLKNLNFKVPRSFRKRFMDCAYNAELKQVELLVAALDAWEQLHKKKN